ncbi:MAG: 50S ribosomal protein L29 [Thermodesulfobacteriota bacterium]|jgi:large subunit ribosomal protein L29
MIKASELRGLSNEELSKKERETREELFNLRVQIATQQTTNVSRINKARRDRARILTVLREKTLDEGSNKSK